MPALDFTVLASPVVVGEILPPAVVAVEVLPPPVVVVELAVGQGPAGPPGSGETAIYPSAGPISGHSVVCVDAAGRLIPADSASSLALSVVGISENAASAAGINVTVRRIGLLEYAGWAWTAGLPIFLGRSGALVQASASGAVFIKPMALALTATLILIAPQPAIQLS